MNERWEYMSMFIDADINNRGAKEYIQSMYPNWTNPPKHAPQTMNSILNEWGDYGWELVHMEPVGEVGKNKDIGHHVGGGASWTIWSHTYFCVFKRRRSE